MSEYAVQLTRAATKDLDQLPAADREPVAEDLQGLADTPIGAPPRIRRLRGFGVPLYRLRSGDYRVLYQIDETLVTVLRVINRRDLDRTLRRLR